MMARKRKRKIKRLAVLHEYYLRNPDYAEFFIENAPTQRIERLFKYLLNTSEGHVRKLVSKFNLENFKVSITYTELRTMMFLLQNGLVQMLNYIDLFDKYGSFLVMSTYAVLSAVLAVPLYFAYALMASYSRKGFFKFWECVPILRGVWVAMVINCSYNALVNMTLASVSFAFIPYAFFNSRFENCNEHNTPNCQMDFPEVRCPNKNNTVNYATQDLLSSVLEERYDVLKYFKVYALVGNGCLWIIAAVTQMFKSKMHHINLSILKYCFIFIALYTPLYCLVHSGSYGRMDRFSFHVENLLKNEFWYEMVIFSLVEMAPGYVIAYAATAPASVSPIKIGLLLFAGRMVAAFTVGVWTTLATAYIFDNYVLIDDLCIQVDGLHVVFAALPFLINTSSYLPESTTLYYILLGIYGFNTAYFTLNALSVAVKDLLAFTDLNYVVPFFLMGFFAICNVLFFHKILSSYNAVINSGIGTVSVMVISVCLIHTYKIRRMYNDFHFVFGTKPKNKWRILLSFYIFVTCVTAVYFSVNVFTQNYVLKAMDYAYLGSYLIAFLLVLAFKLYRYESVKKTFLLHPTHEWGPPNVDDILARRRFNPYHEIDYLSRRECHHECMASSKHLKTERHFWIEKEKTLAGV